jgi:hypothetical protein
MADAAPSYLNGGSHASYPYALNAFNAALGLPLSTPYPSGVFGDYVPDPAPLYSAMPAAMINTSGAYLAGNTTSPTVNDAPYFAANLSMCCWSTNASFNAFVPMDQQLYSQLETQDAVLSISYGFNGTNPRPLSTPPGVVTTTGSATNSGDGSTGGGIEFGLSVSYLGLDTTADSWISAEIAGFFLAMQYQHPTWNMWDIKGALRQTSGNWSTGYNPSNYGYGDIAILAAMAVSAPSAVYLQGPLMAVQNNNNYATVTLYPFRQTRRTREVVYSVNASYSWPVKNEYTTADITASGGTLLYTSNGTDVSPVYTYVPAVSGTVTLVAFTTDGSGNYSRVESFSEQSETITVGTACVP